MKQTSIEWLIDQMFKQGYFDGNKPLTYTNLDHLQQQAKQMHKDEIETAYYHGAWHQQEGRYQIRQVYYNETYGGNNE